ncbi:MAG: phytanoyl-CoA dioxygenase family protein [Planctomycetota bacterium]|nr:phytanoyl-CoA dioxygenase family protein [Planctomycetota bacterium]
MPTAATLPPIFLTPEQICQFHREGFLVVENLTTRDDLNRVQELLDGLFARFKELPPELAFDLGDKKHHTGELVTPQINVAVRFELRLKETLVFERSLEVARQLLGPEAAYSYDHAIYKPPQNGREVPWHQDLAYGRNQRAVCFNANFWIPLQDATIENGCMQFIPWSNQGDLLKHRPIGGDPAVHTLEVDEPLDASKAVACPLKAGGATIQHGKTLHYTGPNRTDAPRRAWIINFGYPVGNTWQKG